MGDDIQEYVVALSEPLHLQALDHLVRVDGQEDLCFATWLPGSGTSRFTALVHELILPGDEERLVHGNASFTARYFQRALATASSKKAGLLLMHSHLDPGWQNLSQPDWNAEARLTAAVTAATELPFVGLTVGTDGAWSGRFWTRTGPRRYLPRWCSAVRVAGNRLQITYHPNLRPQPLTSSELLRTLGVWGTNGYGQLARLHIGIVGLGSVGSIICEALARLGVQRLTLIDYDRVNVLNLDRSLGCARKDVGRLKIDVAADNAFRSATARDLKVALSPHSVAEDKGYRAALDCDLVFSCVDRPWARRVLNHIAYAHLVPIIDGGILARIRGDAFVGADWHVHTVGPSRRCLECLKAFDPSLVGVERDGLLNDPSYLQQLDPDHVLLRHENVFPFSLNAASLELLQLAALVVGPIPNLGDQNYHCASGELVRTEDMGCERTCLYPALVATGDTRVTVTGLDHSAQKLRVPVNG